MTMLNKFMGTFGLLFAVVTGQGFAADPALFHLWQAHSQARGGKTVSCYIQLMAATDDALITSNLALFAEQFAPEKVQTFTALKITASTYGGGQKEVPIKLYNGWLRSSSGSTVARLKIVNTDPETHFLAAASGAEIFQDLLDGIAKDGISVGYQDERGSFDKVVRVTEPLPPEALRNIYGCLGDLQQTLESQ